MSSGDVTCSVLVPVLNEARFIESMVASLRAQRVDGSLEFLFACADSTDGTTETLRRLASGDPRIRLHHNPSGTIPSGLNVALSAARGTFVARMDGHTVYPPTYLAHGIERLRAGGTTWVSGPQRPVGHNRVSRAVALALESSLGRGSSRRWSSAAATSAPEVELDTGVFGGVWLRERVLAYGGWDERWNKNQDSELAARFLYAGERLVCLQPMTADYSPRGSLIALWRQYLEYGRFRAKTARRHSHSLRRSNLLPPALVATAAAAATSTRAARPARALCAVYATALVAAGIDAGRRSSAWADAAVVPLALGVMHAAHGIGLLRESLADGPPWGALAALCGLGRAAVRLERADEVFAPSLER